jgi:hypothetical protein
MRRCIFARVKFLSRVVHCLEFAAIDRNAGSSEQSHAAQSATNRAQTRRIARVVFVEELNLAELEFSGSILRQPTGPSYHSSVLLKLYIYGYLNRV